MALGNFSEMGQQAAFLQSHYGLRTDGVPADELTALYELAEGGRTSREDMHDLHAEVMLAREASAAQVLAVRGR